MLSTRSPPPGCRVLFRVAEGVVLVAKPSCRSEVHNRAACQQSWRDAARVSRLPYCTAHRRGHRVSDYLGAGGQGVGLRPGSTAEYRVQKGVRTDIRHCFTIVQYVDCSVASRSCDPPHGSAVDCVELSARTVVC
eukprot:408385-Prymnesium_polylepis.1